LPWDMSSRGKYSKGVVCLLEEASLGEGEEVFIVSEDKSKESILEKTFGIWEDLPDFLKKVRENAEKRIKGLRID